MMLAMVTTMDNPFDPFTQFDDWFAFDLERGYNTCSYLARIAITSNELSDVDKALAINTAVDEICRLNLRGNYKKVEIESDPELDQNDELMDDETD